MRWQVPNPNTNPEGLAGEWKLSAESDDAAHTALSSSSREAERSSKKEPIGAGEPSAGTTLSRIRRITHTHHPELPV